MRILVFGRQGQLARGLVEAAANQGIEIIAVGRPEVDISEIKSVIEVVIRERPQVVINAAAYTAVDKAESESQLAHDVNAVGAGNIGQACARFSVPIIHVSTDYVFDGKSQRPYRENDSTGPINIYGRSKLEGERNIANATKQHIILRTAWVHSAWGTNFLKTMLNLATTRPALDVVGDQWGSPTYAPHLATVALALARRAASGDDLAWGVYHAVGSGETNWSGFAREIFRRAAAVGLPVCEVREIATAGYPTAARRPQNSRLDGTLLKTVFDLEMPRWEAGVHECVSRLATSATPTPAR